MAISRLTGLICQFNLYSKHSEHVQQTIGDLLKLVITHCYNGFILKQLLTYIDVPSQQSTAHRAVCEAACEAAKLGNLAALALFHGKGIKLWWSTGESSCYSTPWHEAIRHGQREVITFLQSLNQGSDIAEQADSSSNGFMALLRNEHVATAIKVEIAQMLSESPLEEQFLELHSQLTNKYNALMDLQRITAPLDSQKIMLQAGIYALTQTGLSADSTQSTATRLNLSIRTIDEAKLIWLAESDIGDKIRLLLKYHDMVSEEYKQLAQANMQLENEIKQLTNQKKEATQQALISLLEDKEVASAAHVLLTEKVATLEKTVAWLGQKNHTLEWQVYHMKQHLTELQQQVAQPSSSLYASHTSSQMSTQYLPSRGESTLAPDVSLASAIPSTEVTDAETSSPNHFSDTTVRSPQFFPVSPEPSTKKTTTETPSRKRQQRERDSGSGPLTGVTVANALDSAEAPPAQYQRFE